MRSQFPVILKRSCFHHNVRCFHASKSAIELLSEIKIFEKKFASKNDTIERCTLGTERWIKEFVIAHKLCPYAHIYKNSIHVADGADLSSDLGYLAVEYTLLQIQHLISADQKEVSSKLIVFPNKEFQDHWKIFSLLRSLVQGHALRRNITGFELVLFHPLQRRTSSKTEEILIPETEPGNFASRAPYPTIHLFKSRTVAVEVEKWEREHNIKIPANEFGRKTIDYIGRRNVDTLNKIGYRALSKQLQSFTVQVTSPVIIMHGQPFKQPFSSPDTYNN